jgi:hypothetical protein
VQPLNSFPASIQPEGSLPRSQKLSTCTYLSQTNPVHTIPSYLYKIHLNVVCPLMSWSSEWSLSPLAFLPITYAPSSAPFALHAPPTSPTRYYPHKYCIFLKIYYTDIHCHGAYVVPGAYLRRLGPSTAPTSNSCARHVCVTNRRKLSSRTLGSPLKCPTSIVQDFRFSRR